MLVSLTNILILLFSNNITEINILWLIKLTDINSLKVLMVLLIWNLYVFRRYHQYLLTFPKKFNYSILLHDIVNNAKKQIKEIRTNSFSTVTDRFFINSKWNLFIWESLNGDFKNIFNNEDIYCDIKKTAEYNINEILLSKYQDGYSFRISYKKYNIKIIWIKFKFYFREKFYLDYYLPIWIGNISLILLTIKIIYESNNLL